MRPAVIAAAIVGVWLGSAGSLKAGLYNTAEPAEGPAPNKEGVVKPIPPVPFHSLLMDLRKIGAPDPGLPALAADSVGLMGSPMDQGALLTAPALLRGVSQNRQRNEYLLKLDALREKERAGRLTEQDRVNLSAYLLRFGQPEEAVRVLTPAAGRECRNFMILANLATANQLAAPMDPSRLTRASDYLQEALQIWPAEWPGFTSEQLKWYRHVETGQLKLLRVRTREAIRLQGGTAKVPATVDALFGPRDNPLRFVGESGTFEAGKLADAERAKLPPDALASVEQLLLWMPQDNRLYWLYGELLNAQGDVSRAYEVFNYCVDICNYNVPELRDHRLLTKEAKAALAVAPSQPPTSFLPGLSKTLIVGGVGGMIIATFVYLQVRELRRRRQGSSSASKNC